jgi:hypothetical protein
MVKKEIIEDVLKALRRKGDPVSMEQCRVIENRWTDIEVFNHYLAGKSDGERNMVTYWACRDAAQFVHGHLDAVTLVPDLYSMPRKEKEEMESDTCETITISRKDFNDLLRRIEKLEYWTGLKRRPESTRLPLLPDTVDMVDYMQQYEACKLLGYTKKKIRGCADRGELKAWQKNRHVYYLRKQVELYKRKMDMENASK